MTVGDMRLIWTWFARQFVDPLPEPKMKVGPTYIEGVYVWGKHEGGLVSVWPFVPRWVVVHEFAHHVDQVLRMEWRPEGRAFMAACELGVWDKERFAGTLTGMLTGRWKVNHCRRGVPALLPLLRTPGGPVR